MATILVGRWLKVGKRQAYDPRFATSLGATRAGNAAAKKKGRGWVALPPYWTGSHWTVRIAPGNKPLTRSEWQGYSLFPGKELRGARPRGVNRR